MASLTKAIQAWQQMRPNTQVQVLVKAARAGNPKLWSRLGDDNIRDSVLDVLARQIEAYEARAGDDNQLVHGRLLELRTFLCPAGDTPAGDTVDPVQSGQVSPMEGAAEFVDMPRPAAARVVRVAASPRGAGQGPAWVDTLLGSRGAAEVALNLAGIMRRLAAGTRPDEAERFGALCDELAEKWPDLWDLPDEALAPVPGDEAWMSEYGGPDAVERVLHDFETLSTSDAAAGTEV